MDEYTSEIKTIIANKLGIHYGMEKQLEECAKEIIQKLSSLTPDEVREKVTDEIRKQMDLMCGICVTNDLPKPLDLAKVASNNIHAFYAPLIKDEFKQG